jgi:hypothetical protein
MAYVELTDEMLDELKRLKRETGIGPMKLLARSQGVPENLNSAVINTWFNRKTVRAREAHIQFVLNAYSKIVPIIPITPEMRDELNAGFTHTGYSPKSLLNCLDVRPKGLSAALISRWSTGRTASARSDLWQCVIDVLDGARGAQ